MKELSIEEKAKRYDEAINTIRNLVKAGLIYEDAAIQVFPELKESEDERIRNEIIDFIYNKTDTYELREKSNSWLAWLEKQGEKETDDEIENFFNEFEKQGEQNLANSAKTCKDEQRSAWSEEDNKNLEETIWYVEKGGKLIFAKTDKLVSWLKSLKPQPKQEWSEEDRIKCNGAIHLLENLIKEEYFDRDSDDVQVASDLKFACKGLINWLKSLNPQNNITDEELA